MSKGTDESEKSYVEKPLPSNWFLQHPMYQHLMKLEIGESAQVYAAFLVYLDLTEVRQWKEVSDVECAELQLVLLEGREKEGAPVQTVLPLPAHRTLSHGSVRTVLDRGNPMLLCAVASDSSLVYQRMSDGLLTPDPPVGIQDLGRRQHRKRRQQPWTGKP